MVTTTGALAGLSAARPDIDGDACVHGVCATARCRACVDACPRDAIVLTDAALGIDEDACTGCGVCRAACPETAIELPAANFSPLLNTDSRLALVACALSGVAAGAGLVPCVHALSDRDLAPLAGQGIRELAICRAPCSACPHATAATLDAAGARYNTLAASRDQHGVRLRDVTARQFGALRAEALAAGHEVDKKRRAIFGGLLSARAAPVSAKPTGAGALFRFVPSIDASRCSGCDACGRICPHGAIRIERDGPAPGYAVRAESCTGCGLCADVCDENAVAVARMSPVSQTFVQLAEQRCCKCGAVFHLPQQQVAESSAELAKPVCKICQKTCHASLLYQVRS